MKKAKNELRAVAKAARHYLWFGFLFSSFVNLLMLTGPIFMLQVYDRVLGSWSEETLVTLFLLVTFLYGTMAVLDYARGRILSRFGARVQDHLDKRVFELTLENASTTGVTRQSALRDLETVQGFFGSPLLLALFDAPWAPLFFGIIFILHPMLGILALVGGAILIVIAIVNQLLTADRVKKAQATSSAAQMFATDSQAVADVVVSQGMKTSVIGLWATQRKEALANSISSNDWTGVFSAMSKTWRLYLQSAVLALGAYLVLKGEMTAGGIIAASIIMGRALAPLEQAINQWPTVQRARTAWKGIDQLLTAFPSGQERLELPFPKANLSVKGLTVVPFGASKATVSNISFELKPGRALGIIGRSGSGKSSLAKAIVGLWPPTSGEIRFDGATLDQYDGDTLGTYIGYLPQDVALLPGTIAQNIARMAAEPNAEAVIAAAKRANAHEMILSLPEGYETRIVSGAPSLSGGQKQRVGLARAFFGSPVLILLDEPNSALDKDGSDALNQAILAAKAEGCAVIITTHRPNAILECDDLLLMERGMQTAYGPRGDVLKAGLKNPTKVASELEKKTKP